MFETLLLPEIRELLESNDIAGMSEFCQALHPAVVAEVLTGLDSGEAWKVLSSCELSKRVEIFEFLTLPQQEELAKVLDREKLSLLISEMSPDDRVDLLSRMDEEHVESLLPMIAQAERADIVKLLSCPEESAGSVMTTEYASIPKEITAAEAIERIRQQAPDRETIYYVYVLDETRHLEGFVSLRELIMSKPTARVEDIMKREVISLRLDDDQEEVAQQLARYDFIAIPVVDQHNCLVGIVTHDDVLDVIQEEATEDAHQQAAVVPLEDSYLETSLGTIAWKRGVWLLILAIVALLTAEVLNQYEEISGTFRWMVLFIPLVLASGGNAGSQSATLVIRMIALGEIDASQGIHLIRRELVVGCFLGLALSLVGLIAALLWFQLGISQALVVGLTVLLVVLMGTFCGAFLPMGIQKLGMDPALMSNPLIAALVDVLGVVIYYNVAMSMLSGL